MRRPFTAIILMSCLLFTNAVSHADKPILIGLDADMSSGSAQSGMAIERGIAIAIDEINNAGGIMNRPLQLVVKDHRGNPSRGNDNLLDFSDMQDLVAVFSGIHTPVVLKELETIHQNKLLFLVPWAAGTPIIDNDYEPNYVFRVSVRDQFAGEFIVNHALQKQKRKLGLLFEQTGWGRSNERAVSAALEKHGLTYTRVEWFSWGVTNLKEEILRLKKDGAEAILLVANPREGGAAVNSMAALSEDQRLPIFSHWGISGGSFFKDNKEALDQIEFEFLQTFSFFAAPEEEQATKLWQAYNSMFPEIQVPGDVPSPVGTAHAYDLTHLLAQAINAANSLDRSTIRDMMEQLPARQGVMKYYNPAFTSERHDALDQGSFIMAHYSKTGQIRPVLNGDQ